ncbi:hypothetical protein TNIN_91401 [Trichonephila inaurata madagascariensis]|uniref:Uncharacterized protein n=1 Tax=Trichonephila inaurata madagascariensis TaxID=2747483 RepID=A0A8X6YRQ3_9ARAC|nr:hypothetical protein TNIN_91401 [Trichonephila inaurata madagascariensis]
MQKSSNPSNVRLKPCLNPGPKKRMTQPQMQKDPRTSEKENKGQENEGGGGCPEEKWMNVALKSSRKRGIKTNGLFPSRLVSFPSSCCQPIPLKRAIFFPSNGHYSSPQGGRGST